MARRASFFSRLMGEYSSDSATGVQSDRTTPRLTAEIETPSGAVDYGIPDDRQLDFEDEYASDASYVTVDDEFDDTINGGARGDLAGTQREPPTGNTESA